MKKSRLKDVFKTVAAKHLSAVDAEPSKSNQHEFGGLSALKTIWGELDEAQSIAAQFIYFSIDSDEIISAESSITWYDARKNNPERSPEWRIYYKSNPVTDKMKEGDLLIVSETVAGKAIIALADRDSSYATQLKSLFSIREIKPKGFTVQELDSNEELDLPSRYILDAMEVQYDFHDDNYLDNILREFGPSFPSCNEFSMFSRETLSKELLLEKDDEILVQWMEREELLFRTLENHIVLQKVSEGFCDVESFIKYSLSILNRRKSRVGAAFENHLEELFRIRKVSYARGKVTENRVKPDFLFPSEIAYRDPLCDERLLTMLGVKSTCKDRWRQVLSEAERIKNKHLITMEPAISGQQIAEMKSSNLQLIVPLKVMPTYTNEQQKWIWTVSQFIEYIKDKEMKWKAPNRRST